MKFQSGTQFGKYHILSLLGKGGMGDVYLAEDTMLGRRIALKVIASNFTEDGQFERRFQQEARTIARLQHPNIVTIHSLEKIDETLAIDMPYIDGGSLSEVFEGRGDIRARVMVCMHDALSALACCHQEGLVHRDIKPSNILIRGDGVALLSDFGLAKLLAEHQALEISSTSSSGFFMGTPRYSPPESWDGMSPSPTWDVYSAGMVLYETFAPGPPYNALTPMGLVKQIIQKPIPPIKELVPDVSDNLSEVIASMLDQDPDRRPQNAGEALEQLNSCSEWRDASDTRCSTVVQRVVKRPSSLGKRSKTPRRFTFSQVAVVILSIALLGLASAWMLSGRAGRMEAPAVAPLAAEQPATVGGTLALGPNTVFDTIEPASTTFWPNHLLMVAADTPEQWVALASESTRFWYLKVARDAPATLKIEGYWAEYSDTAASLFQQGEVKGMGRWMGSGGEIAVQLEFKNQMDGLRTNRAFTLRKAKTAFSEQDFLRQFASSDYAQPLLYNEIMPRHLPWGQEVEARFLEHCSPVLEALRMPEGSPPVQMDGRLEDSVWKASLQDADQRLGVLAGVPADGNSKLMLRYDASGLYAGIKCLRKVGKPQITFALLTHFNLPVSQSPQWSILFDRDGIQASLLSAARKKSPWECQWRTAVYESEQFLSAEVYIPFANLANASAPKPGDRWRLNCRLADEGQPDGKPLASWGAEDVEALPQGVILKFGG